MIGCADGDEAVQFTSGGRKGYIRQTSTRDFLETWNSQAYYWFTCINLLCLDCIIDLYIQAAYKTFFTHKNSRVLSFRDKKQILTEKFNDVFTQYVGKYYSIFPLLARTKRSRLDWKLCTAVGSLILSSLFFESLACSAFCR